MCVAYVHVCVGRLCGLWATAFPFFHPSQGGVCVSMITDYTVSFLLSFTYCGLRGRPRTFTNCVPSWPFKPRLRWVCKHTCCALCELTQCTTGTLSSPENVRAALIPVKQKHIQSSIKTHILLLVIPDESALFETHIFHTFLKGKCVCSTKLNYKNNRIRVFQRKL